MAADGVALVKLGYDGFAKLLGYFGEHRQAKKLKHQIDAAWRELLKGDAADEAVIEAALAAARKASDTSVDHVRLAELFIEVKKSKGKASGTAKKKAAGKPKGKKAPKKKEVKRKAKKRQ
jgi:hypothetical protein